MFTIRSSYRINTIESVSLASGLNILFTLGFTFILAAVFQILGCAVSPATAPVAFLLSILLLFFHTSPKCFIRSLIIVSILWIITITIASLTIDYSYDGIVYHQASIFAIYRGANFYTTPAGYPDYSLWTLHYAKGLEIIQACFFKLTDNIETGKAINLMLAISSAFILFHTLSQFSAPKQSQNRQSRCLTAKTRLIIVFITMANPVFIGQMLTYYIDYAMYFYILDTICLSYLICTQKRGVMCMSGLAFTIILSIATKFNAAFYETLTLLCILIWITLRHGIKYTPLLKIFLLSAITAVIAVTVFCYHPYVTNYLHFGHPLYPLMGNSGIDIMTENTPEAYSNHNRFTSFIISYFSIIPENVNISVDNRNGGFGVFSFLMLPIAIVSIAIYSFRHRNWVAYMAICILLSCFIFEQSWWARYIPQLWLLIPLAYYTMLSQKHTSVLKLFFIAASAFYVLSTAAGITVRNVNIHNRMNAISEVLRGKEVTIYRCDDHLVRLVERLGIKCRPQENYNSSLQSKIISLYPKKDFALIELSDEDYDKICERLNTEDIQ